MKQEVILDCLLEQRRQVIDQLIGQSAVAQEGQRQATRRTGQAEGVTRSFVNWLLRLTLLAPDIQEAIFEGRQPKAMQLEELTDAMPSEWEKQWNAGRFSPGPDPDGSSKRCDCLPVKSRLAELEALDRHLRIQNPFGRSESRAISAPDGSDAWAPAVRCDADPRAGASAAVEEDVGGGEASVSERNRWGREHRAQLTRLLKLTLLAPDIQEAILKGRQPKGLQLEDLTKPVPTGWQEQGTMLLDLPILDGQPRMAARRQHGSDVIRQAKLRSRWHELS
jgi:ribosome-binding protein aMBF1 (putative translation factor)